MKMFLLLFVLPLASALSPSDQETDCPPLPDVTCDKGKGEIKCRGGIDFYGCPLGDYCATANGNCPAVCANICNKDQELCPGPMIGGCQMQDYCVNVTYTLLNEDGEEMEELRDCPLVCNKECNLAENEIACEREIGLDGCPKENYCAAPSGNCPAVCGINMPCRHIGNDFWKGIDWKQIGVLCPTLWEDGCPMDASECVPKGTCYHVVCPKNPPVECPEGMILGPVLIDSSPYSDTMGCPMPNYCICRYIESADSIRQCDDDQLLCDYGYKNGCWLGDYCADKC